MPVEQRRARRRAVCRKSTLVFEGFRKFDALVKNVSQSGARIDFQYAGRAPGFATLITPTLELRRDVEIIWQTGDRLGVRFIDPR